MIRSLRLFCLAVLLAAAAVAQCPTVVSSLMRSLPTQTLSCPLVVMPGGMVQPDAGQIVTMTVQSAPLTRICDMSLGGRCRIKSSDGYLRPEWFGSSNLVTVPAPTAAPVLAAAIVRAGSRGLASAGDTYRFAYTLVGDSGETLPSPPRSLTTVGRGQLVANCTAPAATRAVGCKMYIRKDGGGYKLAHVSNDVGSRQTLMGFGSNNPLGGIPWVYDPDGAAPPDRNTAKENDGTTTIDNPAVPPAAGIAATIPPGTYYGAISYVAEDGTETALSPVSSGAAISEAGGFFNMFYEAAAPPSGAVFVNVYLGTSPAKLTRQLSRQPLHSSRFIVLSYIPSGAPHIPGVAQSQISGLQAAYDAAIVAPVISLAGGAYETTVPLIFRWVGDGTSIGCTAASTGADTVPTPATSACYVSYKGTLSGGEMVVTDASNAEFRNLTVYDSGGNAKYGWAFAQWTYSGRNVAEITLDKVYVNARQQDSIGLVVDIYAAPQVAHVFSEATFRDSYFFGSGWGCSLEEGFSANLEWYRTGCQGGYFNDPPPSSANSGAIRLVDFALNAQNMTASTYGAQYSIFTTSHVAYDYTGRTELRLVNTFDEANVGGSGLFVEGPALGGRYYMDNTIQNGVGGNANRYALVALTTMGSPNADIFTYVHTEISLNNKEYVVNGTSLQTFTDGVPFKNTLRLTGVPPMPSLATNAPVAYTRNGKTTWHTMDANGQIVVCSGVYTAPVCQPDFFTPGDRPALGNYLKNSENPGDTKSWFNPSSGTVSVTMGQTDPLGTKRAALLIASNGAPLWLGGGMNQPDHTFTGSCWVKGRAVSVMFRDLKSGQTAQTFIGGTLAKFTLVSLTFTTAASSTDTLFGLNPGAGGAATVWGCSVVDGLYPQPYVPTFGAADVPNSFNSGVSGNFFAAGLVQGSLLGQQVGGPIPSSPTIVPQFGIHHVTGSATIDTITAPPGMQGGCITLIPDGLWTTGTHGNIALATTAVVGRALIECWDGSKWYPSY